MTVNLKLKVLPRFPSSVTVESPILLDRTGANYGFSLDTIALLSSLTVTNAMLGPDVYSSSHTWTAQQLFTAGLGYTAGGGGTVTQGTSKATAVTLSKFSGAITLNNASLAAGTIVSFVLTNTVIAATDVLILNHISGGTIGSYSLNAQAAAGSATINIRNNTSGSLSEAIVIQFAVIKGSNT